MFNLFFRPYVPGFRVRAQNEVSGFNIDEHGFPRHETGWFGGMLPGTATVRYPEAAQPVLPRTIRFPIPNPEDGLAEFPIKPQDDAPGFNFQGNGSGAPQQETTPFDGTWSRSTTPQYFNFAQTLTSTPGGASVEAGSPQLPEWLHKLINMPLPRVSTVFDPQTGRRIVPYEPLLSPARSYQMEDQDTPGTGDVRADVDAVSSLPDSEWVDPATAEQWPSSDTQEWPADIETQAGATMPDNTNSRPTIDEAMWHTWLQALKDGLPHPGQTIGQPIGMPPTVPASPEANKNFILGVEQQTSQPRPLLQYQVAQTKLPLIPSSMGLASGLLAPILPHYGRVDEAEGRQPSSDQSRQRRQNENGVQPYGSSSDSPSFGQRIVQSSVDTIVPGAHYQQLARQRFQAGDHIGAAVYQAAAFLDAALGAATLGLSTRLAAAGRTAAAEGTALVRRAFDSRDQLLRYLGRAPEGMQWHHIVEQSQASQFGQRAIHSIENIVAIPIEAHQRINAFYSSKLPISYPETVREWLRAQSFEAQYEFGMQQLKLVLGY
jgi:hypothetical protein